jgi:proprotein convertase subtilisin/kexin type 2
MSHAVKYSSFCKSRNLRHLALLGLTLASVVMQVQLAVQQTGFKRVKRGYKPLRVENLVHHMRPQQDPSDPYFPFQWYLKNTGQNGGKAKLDLNVEAAWAQGVTGKNVTTAIMDDGE